MRPFVPGAIRYVGEFYLGRDPTPFLAALGELESGGLLPPACHVEFIGDVEQALGASTRSRINEHGLGARVTLRPRVPHGVALEKINTAGLLLLLAQGQPTQIPNKLFEYLGTGRPILAAVDHDGESHRMLQAAAAPVFILTERSSREEWLDVVSRAVTASLTVPTADAQEHSQIRDLRAEVQLSRVVARCASLLGAVARSSA